MTARIQRVRPWLRRLSALPDTDDEQAERWYSYPLVREVARLDLKLARAWVGRRPWSRCTALRTPCCWDR